MSKYFKIFIFIFIVSNYNFAQQIKSQKIKGKVIANSNDLEGIYIINMNSDESTLSEKGGYFEINAIEGDTLMFSSVQFKGLKVQLKKENFSENLFFVKMEVLFHVIQDVTVFQYKNINAVSLGIISPDTKHYSPAERRLYTATGGGKNQYGLDTKISVDGILNSLSGRTAMLKKEIEVEKKENLLKKINDLFDDNYFLEKLKIPFDYLKGFQFFLVEDHKFASAMNEKNKSMATFVMNDLSVKYKELLNQK